jgi:hypothetical protein
MNCRAFHDLLQQSLDGTVRDDGAYEAHRRSCPDCAGLQAASLKLLEGVRQMTRPVPPAGLEERITARLLRRQKRFFRGRRVAIPLAIAACLLIAIGARLLWPTPPPVSGPAVDGGGVVKNDNQPPDSAPGGLRESVTEAGEAVFALTGRAADEAVDSTRWLLPRVNPVAPPQPPQLPVAPLQEAGVGVRDGLAPVADSARRAVGVFLRELPVDFSDGRGL